MDAVWIILGVITGVIIFIVYVFGAAAIVNKFSENNGEIGIVDLILGTFIVLIILEIFHYFGAF